MSIESSNPTSWWNWELWSQRSESRDSDKYLHTNVHSSITCSIQRVETTQTFTSKGRCKQNVIYREVLRTILLSAFGVANKAEANPSPSFAYKCWCVPGFWKVLTRLGLDCSLRKTSQWPQEKGRGVYWLTNGGGDWCRKLVGISVFYLYSHLTTVYYFFGKKFTSLRKRKREKYSMCWFNPPNACISKLGLDKAEVRSQELSVVPPHGSQGSKYMECYLLPL